MSGKVSGWVWDTNLPQNEKYVLLAYADHADHDGHNVFPSIKLICQKTGYSRRSVQTITKSLMDKGMLIPEGGQQGGRGMSAHWSIPVKGAISAPIVKEERVQSDTERVQPDALKGAVATAPEPSLTVKETSAFNNRETEKPEKTKDDSADDSCETSQDETNQWLTELEENKPPQLKREPDGAMRAIERYAQKQDGNAEIENFLAKVPERVRPLARVFCEHFTRPPIKKENSYWRTEWEAQADLGLLPKHIKAAISDMENEGLHIKSPASVTSIAERFKRERTASYPGMGVSQVWKGGKRIK